MNPASPSNHFHDCHPERGRGIPARARVEGPRVSDRNRKTLWRGRPFGRLRAGSRPRNAFRRKASSRGPSGPRDLACTGTRLFRLLFWLLPLILLIPHRAQAYVGPGAGFAVLSSFWTLFVAFFYSLYALLTWPFRHVLRTLKRRKAYGKAQFK